VGWLAATGILIVGLTALTLGGDWLVRAASRISQAFGVPPLVIGLTVVAFGTSAPEFGVSLNSAWRGDTELALGNVLGSNIFNVLFILGISALITPLTVAHQLIRIDVPLMIFATALTLFLGWDGNLDTRDGMILFGCLIAYLIWLAVDQIRAGGVSSHDFEGELSSNEGPLGAQGILLQVGLGLLGLAALTVGSQLFVDGAVTIARLLEIDELVIGLTIVAVGTSLPEIATSVMASVRGERDMAVGNVVGSNLFNILGVLGLTSIVSSEGVPVSDAAKSMDLPVALLVAIACLPIFFSWRKIFRWEGALFLGYYVAYVTHLLLHAHDHHATDDIRFIILWVALPFTVILLGWESLHSLFRRNTRQPLETDQAASQAEQDG
jgi:cation:H+ antiporter